MKEKFKKWLAENPKAIRWIKSTFHTFLSGFFAGGFLFLSTLDMSSIAFSALFSGFLNAAVRAAIKAVAEYGIEELKNK